MNEKQAKRLRRAQRRYIADNQSNTNGQSVKRVAKLRRDVVVNIWPMLNHKQRGHVMGRIVERGL